MIHVLPVLFGALLTLATAWSLGMIMLRRIELPLYVWERRLLAFAVGSAGLSEIVFALCAARLLYHGVVLALGAGVIGYAVRSGALRATGKRFAPLHPLWRWGFAAAFAAFSWWAFFNALAPEHSSDGMAYHLAEVLIYSHAHGFPHITTDIYANLSQGIELLYLFAFEFGRHSAAALVHCAFLIVLVFLVLAYGRRIGKPAAGAAAAIITYTCPVMLRDGTTAYVDVALACLLFALFYLLQLWDESRDSRLLLPIGILAGFGYAIKYTAFLAVPYAIGFVAWKLWRARQPAVRALLTITIAAAAMFLPWMLKDWIEVANPVSPFANRIFPNPYVRISFEDDWRRRFATYTLHSRWQIPWEVTMGGQLSGFLGPVFLLTPLALLVLRLREGRQLLLAAFTFGTVYFENIGTRFLIPLVPFVSLAIGLTLINLPWLLTVVTSAAVLTCWPGAYSICFPHGSWRLEGVPIAAALRLVPEDTYLRQDPDYVVVQMVEHAVPPGERIFAFGQGGRSYLRRELLISYQSAFGEVLRDILWTPMVPDFQPSRRLTLRFPPRQLTKVRVVQRATLPDGQWSIAEVHILDGSVELHRDRAWRLMADPNPWDVEMAFDHNPVTRWRSWEPPAAGMYVEAGFGQPATVSAVTIETSNDSDNSKLEVTGLTAGGHWILLSNRPEEERQKYDNLRLAATAELRARGIRYLLVKDGDYRASDFTCCPGSWELRLAGEAHDARLYRIE